MNEPGMGAAVCVGKSCRRRPEHGAVREMIVAAGADVVDVACLGVCKGPVVVLGTGGDDAVVLKKVRGKKARRKLSVAVDSPGKLPKRLRELVVAGSKRVKALQRAQRSVERSRRRAGGS